MAFCSAIRRALLGQAGMRTLVVDRSHDVHPKPRAIPIDHGIMRVSKNLGLADVVAQRFEPFTPSECYGVVRLVANSGFRGQTTKGSLAAAFQTLNLSQQAIR